MWDDGDTQASRNDLGLETYRVSVTDANGCVKDGNLEQRIPTRDDWTMNGNEIQPQQFIGSTNEVDVEFRAFNQPQLRLGADGVTRLLGGVEITNAEDLEEAEMVGAKLLVATSGGEIVMLGDDLPTTFFANVGKNSCGEDANGNNIPWWDNGIRR